MSCIFGDDSSPTLVLAIHIDPDKDTYEIDSWGYVASDTEAIDESIRLVSQVIREEGYIAEGKSSLEASVRDYRQEVADAEAVLRTQGMVQFNSIRTEGVSPYTVMIVKPHIIGGK